MQIKPQFFIVRTDAIRPYKKNYSFFDNNGFPAFARLKTNHNARHIKKTLRLGEKHTTLGLPSPRPQKQTTSHIIQIISSPRFRVKLQHHTIFEVFLAKALS